MSTLPLLLFALGCSWLEGEDVRWWHGVTVYYDGDGVQQGAGGEMLVKTTFYAQDARVVEEVWRFDDPSSFEVWDMDIRGADVETMSTAPDGNYAILGEFTAGDPYAWTAWNWTWTWLDGEMGGQYTRIDATVDNDERGSRDSYVREITTQDISDQVLWTRSEDLLQQSEEEWNVLFDNLGG